EDTFVAGLSMGGYGALKWALRRPHRFAGVASMSGALDISAIAREDIHHETFERIFDGIPGPDDDLFGLLREADPMSLPPMHVSCGTEDQRIIAGNRAFAEAARQAGVHVTV